jgi:hypothetical protein
LPEIVPPDPSDWMRKGPLTVAPISSRASRTARAASSVMSMPRPLAPPKSNAARPETWPLRGVAPLKLSSTRREPPKRPAAWMRSTTVPVTALSRRAPVVRTDPRMTGS